MRLACSAIFSLLVLSAFSLGPRAFAQEVHDNQDVGKGCPVFAATLWTKGLGTTALSSAGTDVMDPWEPQHQASRIEIKFCDKNVSARFLSLAKKGAIIDHVVIRKRIKGPVFDMHGVTVLRTGIDDFISLHFKSITVTPPAPPAG